MNIARSSKYKIKIDYEKSHGSFLYDKNTQKEYLDFFGMYASLVLGYNHPIFKTKGFTDEILRVSKFKVNNCEFVSDETEEFDKIFTEFCGKGIFQKFHYTCTGALAVEAAIKAAIEYKNHPEPKILSFNNSFHGINSYGGFVTSRFPGANLRLKGFPEPFSIKKDCDLKEVERCILSDDITCILVEPIQCSAGDIHHKKSFFEGLRHICTEQNIPLIFDEIQIGFGSTGKLWYYENIGITPDIVIFGKKTQLSGIMIQDKFSSILSSGPKLEVTWDGDVVDMVRCKHIIKYIQENNVLDNVSILGDEIINSLRKNRVLKNVRGVGLIIGFDLEDKKKRDNLVKSLYDSGLICNSTGERSVRLRPSLDINRDEINQGIFLIQEACKKI